MSHPNSSVLLCTAANVDAVNLAVGLALGDIRINPGTGQPGPLTRNLSRPLSANGSTVTHYGGHAWLTDEQAKALAAIPNLTMQAAVLDEKPKDNWLVSLKSANLRTVDRDRDGKQVIPVRSEPQNEARIAAARAVFEAKPNVKPDPK